ncbi:MAG: putative selenium-dependent hydroxylase accessory protein YqeC [Acidimicrobiia bacterium]|nr:putative selenium-dependent hydroxylase accessory protein YqeC [Acidimicrobiia bacterium]
MNLIGAFGLGARELIAFTGGGGKTTLLLQLSRELAARRQRTVITTTTRLGLDQTEGVEAVWSLDPFQIESALDDIGTVFLLSEGDGRKVRGFEPEIVDELFADTSAAYVLVEADGARGRPLKAPAGHEPVVPSATSIVVVVMGIDAVGRTLFEAAHRPATAAALTGLAESDRLTAHAAATILTHPAGGLKGIPAAARVVIALTKVDARSEAVAEQIAAQVTGHRRVDRVVGIPFDGELASTPAVD